MMHIDRDVVGIFVHEGNTFFALDVIQLCVRELRCRIRAISTQHRATRNRIFFGTPYSRQVTRRLQPDPRSENDSG